MYKFKRCHRLQSKKAQGLSLNTIIIAALALLVLIIIAVILSGRAKIFGTASRDCGTMGGSCKPSCDSNEAKGGDSTSTNCASGQSCCVPVYATTDS